MVRAKFNVAEIAKYGNGNGKVVLNAVTGGTKENESFWRYTPSGKIEIWIDNPEAFKAFEFGEYYVDFTKAENNE